MRAGIFGAAQRQIFERAQRALGGPGGEELMRRFDPELLAPDGGLRRPPSRAEVERAGQRELSAERRARRWPWRLLSGLGIGRRRSRCGLRSLAALLAAPSSEEVGAAARAGLFRLARAFADADPSRLAEATRDLPPAWRALARAAWESQRERCPARECRRLRREFFGGGA